MPDKEYYTSERFIWDSLIRQAEKGVGTLQSMWRKNKCIPPFLVTWPANPVKAEGGSIITGTVLRKLENDPSTWLQAAVEAIKLTDAYALLRTHQEAGLVRVILESQHGARSWTLPIVRSGDVNVLGKPEISVDGLHIGLLWRPRVQND